MEEGSKISLCKECSSVGIEASADVEHLQEHLNQKIVEISSLKGDLLDNTTKFDEEVTTWREKYERLYDSHKRVQKLNQTLEDKLLRLVDRMKSEKTQLTKDIATLSVRLAESKHSYGVLQKENERYKNDMNLAIQLLQCKPDNFVSQKLDSLSSDTQARVSQYVMSKAKCNAQPKGSTQNDNETFDASEYEFNISASLMSKILEDSIQDTVTKHCDTCTCAQTKSKPFYYNDSHYSVATQTYHSGEMKNSYCLNCNTEMKSLQSSVGSASPHAAKLVNEKHSGRNMYRPLYIIPQPTNQNATVPHVTTPCNTDDKNKLDASVQDQIISKIGEDLRQLRQNNGMDIEPSIHHKLCERTKEASMGSKSGDGGVDTLLPIKTKDSDGRGLNSKVRKDSQGSLKCGSRASSVAKSTTSTHKSNTHVGPGPRFCSLRVQAGSKNILLDNAQPDVPPVLYKRHTKFENPILDELNDGTDNLLEQNNEWDDDETVNENKKDSNVVETTLIDVNIDSHAREKESSENQQALNPILMNVSSSPLQPQKTHNFANGASTNTPQSGSVGKEKDPEETDKRLSKKLDFLNTADMPKDDLNTPPRSHDLKLFNFDQYEQRRMSKDYAKSLRKLDKSQINSINMGLGSSKISRETHEDFPKVFKKSESRHIVNLPAPVNVYSNLTQTHLKVDTKNELFNELSTSSLSSDDSAVVLQKQQLLRVAEWVKQNHEQQSTCNDQSSLDEDLNFKEKKDSVLLNKVPGELHQLALNMPHPVSKYSKTDDKDNINNIIQSSSQVLLDPGKNKSDAAVVDNASKENTAAIGHVDSDDISRDENVVSDLAAVGDEGDGNTERVSKEEMARMEYNVKKFLLSGPRWTIPDLRTRGRGRRTSSKTETDV